jgi:hypothetical protein
MADELLTIDGVTVSSNLLAPSHGEHCVKGECQAACCVGGIWVDLLEVQHILDHAEALRPFLAPEYAANEDLWFEDEDFLHTDFPSGVALATRTVPRVANPQQDGCIFLRADHLCALHVASDALGLGWPGLKPFECATYPIRRSEGVIGYDEETTAANPHADCQRPVAGPPRARLHVFRTEIELAIGQKAWQLLTDRAK